MQLEIGWHEVQEKLAKLLTKEDYLQVGHFMVPIEGTPVLQCNRCDCWEGSEFSMNRCGLGVTRVGGYLDFTSPAISRLKERVGTIGIPIRERRVI